MPSESSSSFFIHHAGFVRQLLIRVVSLNLEIPFSSRLLETAVSGTTGSLVAMKRHLHAVSSFTIKPLRHRELWCRRFLPTADMHGDLGGRRLTHNKLIIFVPYDAGESLSLN